MSDSRNRGAGRLLLVVGIILLLASGTGIVRQLTGGLVDSPEEEGYADDTDGDTNGDTNADFNEWDADADFMAIMAIALVLLGGAMMLGLIALL